MSTMKKKVFISINIVDKIRHRLIKNCEKWQNLPVKWTKEDNLSVRLFFLGYIDDNVIFEICQKISKVIREAEFFDLKFEKISLFPDINKPQEFRVIGKASKELKNLYEMIEKELNIFVISKKFFSPSILLGKIKKEKWEKLKNKPFINEKISFSVGVEAVDIIANHFNKDKNKFILVESFPLK